MRSNADVAISWREGKSANARHLSTDGQELNSYATTIAFRIPGSDVVLHNGDRLSQTTSGHQSIARRINPGPIVPFSALRSFEVGRGISVIEVGKDKHWLECVECRTTFNALSLESCSECGQREFRYRHRLGHLVFRFEDRYFLGAFDEQESLGRCYFVSELPRAVADYADAIDALMPDEVRGKEFRRQGDVFLVECGEPPRPDKSEIVRNGSVFKTNHIASQLYEVEDAYGRQRAFVRGVLYHRPAGRRADHSPVYKLKEWHEAIPNASRQAGFMTFSLGGRVD